MPLPARRGGAAEEKLCSPEFEPAAGAAESAVGVTDVVEASAAAAPDGGRVATPAVAPLGPLCPARMPPIISPVSGSSNTSVFLFSKKRRMQCLP